MTQKRTSDPPHACPSLHRVVRSLPDRCDYSEDRYTRDSLQRKFFAASIPSKVANQGAHHAGHCVRSLSPFHVGDRSPFPNDTAQASLSQRGMNFKVVLARSPGTAATARHQAVARRRPHVHLQPVWNYVCPKRYLSQVRIPFEIDRLVKMGAERKFKQGTPTNCVFGMVKRTNHALENQAVEV